MGGAGADPQEVPMRAFLVELDNRTGSLAQLSEAIADPGINVVGVVATTSGGTGSVGLITTDDSATRSALESGSFTYREVELVSASLENQPGTLAAAARRLAEGGVNIELVMPTGMEGGKVTVAFGVDDPSAARQALGELAAPGG
jgi:hypothetical protein